MTTGAAARNGILGVLVVAQAQETGGIVYRHWDHSAKCCQEKRKVSWCVKIP